MVVTNALLGRKPNSVSLKLVHLYTSKIMLSLYEVMSCIQKFANFAFPFIMTSNVI
jgi:hypothetical protein